MTADENNTTTELFNVIIVAAEPRALTLIRPTAWRRSLAPGGILAVITHGQRTPAKFHDPGDSLVRAGREDGLKYLDRIAVVQVPIDDTAPNPVTPVGHGRAHADLHVFVAGQGDCA